MKYEQIAILVADKLKENTPDTPKNMDEMTELLFFMCVTIGIDCYNLGITDSAEAADTYEDIDEEGTIYGVGRQSILNLLIK